MVTERLFQAFPAGFQRFRFADTHGFSQTMSNRKVTLIKRETSLTSVAVGTTITSTHHAHPLVYQENLGSHRCDICRGPLHAAFRCDGCDFDLCRTCRTIELDRLDASHQQSAPAPVSANSRQRLQQLLRLTLRFQPKPRVLRARHLRTVRQPMCVVRWHLLPPVLHHQVRCCHVVRVLCGCNIFCFINIYKNISTVALTYYCLQLCWA